MSVKNMVKIFNQLQGSHDLYSVFNDFLEMSAIAISNSCDLVKKKQREADYKKIIKQYTKDEQLIFPQILAELVRTMEHIQFGDVLGELFMQLELGSKWKGQFFTPYNLSVMCARMCLNNMDKLIEQNGFITLNEPSVGGGAMVIAVAQVMKEHHYNPQKQLKVVCNDLDIKAVYMTYIQLSLLGIPAKVIHQDTLSLEKFDTFRTPFWILGMWEYRKEKVKADPIIFNTVENKNNVIDGQLTMF